MFFRNRGREGGRQTDRHQSVAFHTILNEDQTRNLGMCPDWGSNYDGFGVRADAPTN